MKFSEWCKIRETVATPGQKTTYWNWRGDSSVKDHPNPDIEDAIQKLQSINKEIRMLAKQVLDSGHFEEYPQFRDSFMVRIRQAADGVTSAHAILKPNPEVPVG